MAQGISYETAYTIAMIGLSALIIIVAAVSDYIKGRRRRRTLPM